MLAMLLERGGDERLLADLAADREHLAVALSGRGEVALLAPDVGDAVDRPRGAALAADLAEDAERLLVELQRFGQVSLPELDDAD